MSESPRVSVVIPNYNYARFVDAAVESALGQTLPPLEVIVVDNGSTDNSLEVLKKFGEKIRVIAQENRGQAGSRNRGMVEARGEFVAFLDADDLWRANKLEKQMKLFSDSEVGLVCCALEKVHADLTPISVIEPKKRGWVLPDFALGVGAVVLGGESTAVMRKSILDKVGIFDSRLSIATGWDMWRRIASVARIDFVPEPLVQYRQHGSNASAKMEIYAGDTEQKLVNLFSDPLSRAVWPLKRQSLSVHYLGLYGGFYHVGNFWSAAFLCICICKCNSCINYFIKAVWYRPALLLEFPLKKFSV